MTLGQGIDLGPFSLTVIRMLVGFGFIRVIVRSERLAGAMNSIDWLMIAWAAWALLCSFFYRDTFGVIVNRLGLVYNSCGVYFLLRVFCQSLDDVTRLCRITAILLVPLSIEMLYEMITGHNLFSVLGGVSEISEIRDGMIRAQGPFAHSILAGTVGAVCLPIMLGLWQQHRKTAVAGTLACFSMVFASASSGPIMSALSAIGALFMWHWRHKMRIVRWVAVLGYIGLDLLMNAPAYFIIARIDLTGRSTSWHRAELIESAIGHLSEWWLAGTDYTRHWMPTGVPWSENHTDITNHYLNMGVVGRATFDASFHWYLGQRIFFCRPDVAEDSKPPIGIPVYDLGNWIVAIRASDLFHWSHFFRSIICVYLSNSCSHWLYSNRQHTTSLC